MMRASATVPRHGRPDILPRFPARVNIQTRAGCNALCTFCPNSTLGPSLPQGSMKWDLFTRIVDECAEHPMERVNPFLMNEPLLDPNIARCVRYIKDKLDDRADVMLISNGSVLTPELMQELIDSRLDLLKISIQGYSGEVYESLMPGLSRDRAYANVEQAIALVRELGVGRPALSVSIVTVHANEHEIREFKRYWRRQGIKAISPPVENRGGNIADMSRHAPSGIAPRTWCHRPFREACILFNGDMVLCCADWTRTVILGKIERQTIESAWNSPKAVAIRQATIEGNTGELPEICRRCTVSALPDRQHRSFNGYWQRLLHWIALRRRNRTLGEK